MLFSTTDYTDVSKKIHSFAVQKLSGIADFELLRYVQVLNYLVITQLFLTKNRVRGLEQ